MRGQLNDVQRPQGQVGVGPAAWSVSGFQSHVGEVGPTTYSPLPQGEPDTPRRLSVKSSEWDMDHLIDDPKLDTDSKLFVLSSAFSDTRETKGSAGSR